MQMHSSYCRLLKMVHDRHVVAMSRVFVTRVRVVKVSDCTTTPRRRHCVKPQVDGRSARTEVIIQRALRFVSFGDLIGSIPSSLVQVQGKRKKKKKEQPQPSAWARNKWHVRRILRNKTQRCYPSDPTWGKSRGSPTSSAVLSGMSTSALPCL